MRAAVHSARPSDMRSFGHISENVEILRPNQKSVCSRFGLLPNEFQNGNTKAVRLLAGRGCRRPYPQLSNWEAGINSAAARLRYDLELSVMENHHCDSKLVVVVAAMERFVDRLQSFQSRVAGHGCNRFEIVGRQPWLWFSDQIVLQVLR